MSTRELRRAEVLGRVKGQTLRLVEAAERLEVSYRQAKRLWRRYREEGAKGLEHGSAGRASNRAKPEKFRRKVVRLIREKYSGAVGERFGRRWQRSIWRMRMSWKWGGDAATLDVGGGIVEPQAQTQSAPEAQGAAGTLWRLGAAGRQFP